MSRKLTLAGFETPFERELNPDNRWVVLSKLIPWDDICGLYLKQVGISPTGRPGLSPRVVLGSLIIKHLCNLDGRETVDQISENIYMQYFLGYPSFSNERPFDASLFVEFRKRLGLEALNAINERIVELKTKLSASQTIEEETEDNGTNPDDDPGPHRGRVIFDATACPQDIAFPTGLNLLSEAREISERLIDTLYLPELHAVKPRTYRQIARKYYLKTAQKKNKSKKDIGKAVGRQLGYLKRNITSILRLLCVRHGNPLFYLF